MSAARPGAAGVGRRGDRASAALLVPLLVVAGSVGFAVVGVIDWYRADRTYEALDRFAAGAPVTIQVAEPGRQQVWVRHDDYASASESTVAVDRDGRPVAVRRLSGTSTLQVGDDAITAVHAFEAESAGSYTVRATDPGGSGSFLVGTGDPAAERRSGTRRIERGAIGGAAGLAGLAVVATVLVRRARREP